MKLMGAEQAIMHQTNSLKWKVFGQGSFEI